MTEFSCQRCGASFSLSEDLHTRYPGWAPRLCRSCWSSSSSPETSSAPRAGGAAVVPGRSSGSRNGERPASRPRRGSSSANPVRESLTVDQVLARYHAGPTSGVFTDGSAQPNPGPGGWGAVYVVDDQIVDQAYGREADTTNNRMELMAILRGCDLVPAGPAATIYTDSRLACDTMTKWAPGWERRGWKRKTGEVQNLDLVQAVYRKLKARPELRLEWIPGHAGYRWNEYADALSTAWLRQEV